MPQRHRRRRNHTWRKIERRKVAIKNLQAQLKRYKSSDEDFSEKIKKAEICLDNTKEKM